MVLIVNPSSWFYYFFNVYEYWSVQDEGVESDDLKKDLPLLPPPPDSSSMKLTIKEIWFSFAAPTNMRSQMQAMSRYTHIL